MNLLHYGLRSQAKMHALVAGRKITARRGDSCELTALARDQAYFGANRVAVALMSYKMQRQPVVRARRPVVEHVCLPVIGGDHSIELAIVIDIADGHSPGRPGRLKQRSGSGGDVHKSVTGVSCQQHGFAVAQLWISQLHRVENVALRYQQILPAIVVIIEEAHAPAGMQQRHASEAGTVRNVTKGSVAIVLK